MKNVIKRIKAILTALMYVAIYDAVAFIVQLGFVFWKRGAEGVTLQSAYESMTDGSYALMVISMIISFWIFLIVGKIRKKPLYTFISEEKYPFMVYVMSALMAIGLRMLVAVYYYFSGSVAVLRESIEKAAEFSPSLNTPAALLIALFGTVVMAPIFEEVLFRGIVMRELLNIMRPWAAILLQGIIFGVAHGVLFQSFFAGMVGVALGIIYYKTGDIKTAMVCHGMFNYSVVITGAVSAPVTAVVFTVFGVLLTALSMTYIIKNRKN